MTNEELKQALDAAKWRGLGSAGRDTLADWVRRLVQEIERLRRELAEAIQIADGVKVVAVPEPRDD